MTGWPDTATHLSLRTYRRDGTGTVCPVWTAVDRHGHPVFRTFDRTLKARRLSRRPAVQIAPCDRDGTPTGPYRSGVATPLGGARARSAGRALLRRHGLRKLVADLVYRPRLGRIVTYVVTLADARPAASGMRAVPAAQAGAQDVSGVGR
jgi:PPOX class probable F420-dependent enzyme